jgi:two-component system phosphate regulon sensor histidine kinase PhoR
MPSAVANVQPRTLRGRLLLGHAVAIVGVLLILGVVVDRVLERHFTDQLTDSLTNVGRAIELALPEQGDLQPAAVRLGQATGTRVTVIGTDGVVLADSQQDPAGMDNHRNRPEVSQALAGRVGGSSRESATVGGAFRYVALPPRFGRIVRVALPLSDVESKVQTVRLILAAGFGLAALASLLVLAAIARGLSVPLRRMAASVERLDRQDLTARIPEEGTDELIGLARTVNQMRDEVASQVDAMGRDRAARDAILSALDEGIVLFGAGGNVLYQNSSAVRLLEGPIQDARSLVPSALRELMSSIQRGRDPRPMAASGSESEVVEGPSGRTLHAAATLIPGDGSVLLVLRDVTEAKRVDAVRRDFVANASHELKTPAAAIQALAETIAGAASEDPKAVARFAEQLRREAGRLARVISDLLDLSRLEGEAGERTELRLDRIAVTAAERSRSRAERAGISLEVAADGPVRVSGSSRDLGLLVHNLIENAIQYTRRGGRVNVSIAADGAGAVLVVRDSGIGIPAKEQSRIFERFYRVDRARSRQTGGTGLGLSIVKHVAENHGGTVTVQSELGQGSTFTVRLPLVR